MQGVLQKNKIKEEYIILDETESEIPNPFPFPKFPLDVAVALQKGEITARSHHELIRGVARGMFSFKRHPTQRIGEG